MEIPEAWKLIKEIGWETKSTNTTELAKKYFAKWGKEKMNQLGGICNTFRDQLYYVIEEYEEVHGERMNVQSDDTLSDTLWHIIGLGKTEFDKTIKNPKLVEKRAQSGKYVESFSYVFLEPEPDLPRTQKEKTETIGTLRLQLIKFDSDLEHITHQLNTLQSNFQQLTALVNQVLADHRQ